MLGNGVDHLFCNEEEALDWARTDRLDVAIAELKDIGRTVNITVGPRGSVVISGHGRWDVPGFPVKPIDTNGAGDIYAGACLAGWSAGMPPTIAAYFGNLAAARLITRFGARLATLVDYQSVLDEFRKLPA
jgi:sugar/nucleoside kinase (ribokinase family)